MLADGFIFLQRNWLSCNSLLLKNHDEAVLIDTGYLTHADLTLRVLQEHLGGQPLTSILNTHLHSDHCGGNAKLQQFYTDVSIYIPSTQWEAVNSWDPDLLSFETTGQSCLKFSATHRLVAGSDVTICGLPWQVIGSPGHDADSLMLFQPDERILVSADALWESSVSVVFPALDGCDGFQDALSTLDVIEKLNPKVVVPGHGALFTDIQSALAKSRSKLDLFRKDPQYHATYSAKVLIKFKLMELGRIRFSDFQPWCLTAPLMQSIHQQFFSALAMDAWLEQLLFDFEKRKSIFFEDGFIVNC